MSQHKMKTKAIIMMGESEAEIELPMVAEFSFHPGCRQTLEQPGEGPSCDLTRLRIHPAGEEEQSAPGWMFKFLEGSDAFQTDMLTHVFETEEHAQDEDADRRREDSALRASEWAKGRA